MTGSASSPDNVVNEQHLYKRQSDASEMSLEIADSSLEEPEFSPSDAKGLTVKKNVEFFSYYVTILYLCFLLLTIRR